MKLSSARDELLECPQNDPAAKGLNTRSILQCEIGSHVSIWLKSGLQVRRGVAGTFLWRNECRSFQSTSYT